MWQSSQTVRCSKCTEHHIEKNCKKNYRCLHCNDTNRTADKSCPVQKEQQTITKIQDEKKIRWAMAKQQYRDCFRLKESLKSAPKIYCISINKNSNNKKQTPTERIATTSKGKRERRESSDEEEEQTAEVKREMRWRIRSVFRCWIRLVAPVTTRTKRTRE